MANDTPVGTEEPTITLEDVRGALEQTWIRTERVLARFSPALSAGPDAGGWDARHALSHVVGAWQRVPIHAGFYLAGAQEVPIQLHNPYWIAEWETAPLEAFVLAMRGAYEGNRVFLDHLDPALLSRRAQTPFGNNNLGE